MPLFSRPSYGQIEVLGLVAANFIIATIFIEVLCTPWNWKDALTDLREDTDEIGVEYWRDEMESRVPEKAKVY